MRPRRVVRWLLIAIASFVSVAAFGVVCLFKFPFLLFAPLMVLVGRGDPSWRPIADSPGLVADCAALVAAVSLNPPPREHVYAGYTTIPYDEWPARIHELFPVRLRVDNQSCRIFYRNRFRDLTWGYLVFPSLDANMPLPCDRPSDCTDQYVWPTEDPRIVRWESIHP